jgi:hypothetical protein
MFARPDGELAIRVPATAEPIPEALEKAAAVRLTAAPGDPTTGVRTGAMLAEGVRTGVETERVLTEGVGTVVCGPGTDGTVTRAP